MRANISCTSTLQPPVKSLSNENKYLLHFCTSTSSGVMRISFRLQGMTCVCGSFFALNDISAPWRPQQPWLTTGARYACKQKSQERMLALTPLVATSSRMPRSELPPLTSVFVLQILRARQHHEFPIRHLTLKSLMHQTCVRACAIEKDDWQ